MINRQKNMAWANLTWTDKGEPYATTFKDTYYTQHDGLGETRHVFLNGNNLPTRWQQPTPHTFHILETGFGTGLNFLATCNLHTSCPDAPQLMFTSIEKHPLTLKDFTKAAQRWPELSPYADSLIEGYAELIQTGIFQTPNKRITLYLYIGDAQEMLATQNIAPVDAFYLDGFSPAQNPDMWTPALYQSLSEIAATESTLATFTAAGHVKRGLEAAGFSVTKTPGFARKREMITAVKS